MAYVTTEDGAEIYYKDWGSADAQPIVFHHGWPLSSDDWDAQLLYFMLTTHADVSTPTSSRSSSPDRPFANRPLRAGRRTPRHSDRC